MQNRDLPVPADNDSINCDNSSTAADDLIIRQYQTLQRVRLAARRAAEIAEADAQEVEVARLKSAAAANNNDIFSPSPFHSVAGTPFSDVLKTQHPASQQDNTVSASDYDVAAANASVLQARADRVLALGTQFFIPRVNEAEQAKEALEEEEGGGGMMEGHAIGE